jgi:hypothetical protein
LAGYAVTSPQLGALLLKSLVDKVDLIAIDAGPQLGNIMPAQ